MSREREDLIREQARLVDALVSGEPVPTLAGFDVRQLQATARVLAKKRAAPCDCESDSRRPPPWRRWTRALASRVARLARANRG